MSPNQAPIKRKRGRPEKVVRVYDLAVVARRLAWDVEALARLIEIEGVLPGAFPDDLAEGGWRVPASALRGLLGEAPLEQHCTVDDVRISLRLGSVHTVYAWLRLKDAQGRFVLPSRKILGRVLIRAADVLALPAKLPPGAASSFFASRPTKSTRTPATAPPLSFFAAANEEGETNG